MSITEWGITEKKLPAQAQAVKSMILTARAGLGSALAELAESIPAELIAGPALCTFQFISPVSEGQEVEIAFPLTRPVEIGGVHTRVQPGLKVLSLLHDGPAEELTTTYRTLFGRSAEHGLITDEFCREVYTDWRDPMVAPIEVQMVLHDWTHLLKEHCVRVLGVEQAACVLQGHERITTNMDFQQRYACVKEIVERIDKLDDFQKFDILSSCAHVFPDKEIARIRNVYKQTLPTVTDPLDAVDAVLDFMETDPVWGKRPERKGNIIYSSKAPRDLKAYEAATTDEERRRAACFCPLVRSQLPVDMPRAFCYCGGGWFRRQWEGVFDAPVRVEVCESIMAGDGRCAFAVHLPKDL